MAKVTQPLGSSEARGAVGGYVYNTWRGISTVRTRVTPKKENEERQILVRELAANVTVAWQATTGAIRSNWDYYASQHPDHDWTGNPKRLSGYNWFMRVNFSRQQFGREVQYVVPYNITSVDITGLTISWNVSVTYLEFLAGPWAEDEDQYFEVWRSGPWSAARNPSIHNSKIIGGDIFVNLFFSDEPGVEGWYTYFIRATNVRGFKSGWHKASIFADFL